MTTITSLSCAAFAAVLPAAQPEAECRPAQGKSVRTILDDLVAAKLAEAEGEMKCAESLREANKISAAKAALENARKKQAEARKCRSMTHRHPKVLRIYLADVEDLSVMRVRVLRAEQMYPDLRKNPSELTDELAAHMEKGGAPLNEKQKKALFEIVNDPVFRITTKIFDHFVHTELYQDVDVQIIDIDKVGKRYSSHTRRGKKFPSQLREDLRKGETIELDNDAPDTGVMQLEKGKDYWIAITPPIASKLIPRAYGASGRTRIVFAISADSPQPSPRRDRGPRSF